MINNKRDMGAEVEWKGPSKVVAINGKKLFIDNGARLATVNRDDIVRIFVLCPTLVVVILRTSLFA